MKIAVLLSGGVDSSSTLAILKQKGYDIQPFYIKVWLEDELSFLGNCPWEEDIKYAKAVCDMFGLKLKIVSLQREYYNKVVSYALNELRRGFTPSPDIFCNKKIKFGIFYDKFKDKYDYIATGHYARIEKKGDNVLLKTSPDPIKDQTYFLAHLNKVQLKHAMFPIGDMTKKEVREFAKRLNLPPKDRKDSQGICFLGKIKYREFIKHHFGEKKGEIRELTTNKRLGFHKGYWYYTIGQRQGLGLSRGPWYVVKKDVEKNIIYVIHQKEQLKFARNKFKVGEFNWINNEPESKNLLKMKIRHGEKFYKCKLIINENNKNIGEVEIIEEKDPGIAPGQFAVFYDNDICLGCGKILE